MFLCLLGLFVKLRLISTGCKWGSFLRRRDEFICLVLCSDQKINLSAFWEVVTPSWKIFAKIFCVAKIYE
jgi:hypothetical protein